MNVKKTDRFFNRFSWIVLGVYVVYVVARLALSTEMAAEDGPICQLVHPACRVH